MNNIFENREAIESERKSEKKIKCVVWDLDNTIWDGVILEDGHVTLKANVPGIIKTLDSRGILQSIASKNDHDLAISRLKESGLDEYFIYPQINWNPKSSSVKTIAESINISIDTIAFIDDQPFEREEVRFKHPDVLCIDAADLDKLLDMPRLNPDFITADSTLRRKMYQSDIRRNQIAEIFPGTEQEFLASLDMVFTISQVGDGDLQRAEELTLRTNQLNATGYTYSYNELDCFRKSDKHKLLIAGLEDKFGTYGKIGLALIECGAEVWTLNLLLMSCRVMSRGVGSIMLNHVIKLARDTNVKLQAIFVPTDKNRMMYITYKFAGFKAVKEENGYVILENDFSQIQSAPEYVKVITL